MRHLNSYNNFESIFEKSIGSESIRMKYYSDIDKKAFYKLVNTDPTSVRKKEFSKPGKYSKWLLIQYRRGSFGTLLNDENYMKKLNYLLFIFSTGWFKSRIKNYYSISGQSNIGSEKQDIFKYKSLSDFINEVKDYIDEYESATEKSKFDTVYSDDKIDILVPLNFTASFETAKNTEWCSQSLSSYSSWNQQAILFRIMPKSSNFDKLKLTWGRIAPNNKNPQWYLACSKYPELIGTKSPFDVVEDGIEKWEDTKIILDQTYDDESGYSSKWKDNSKKISNTMSLVSKEAKKFIEEYHNKQEHGIGFKKEKVNEGIIGTISKGKELLNKFNSPIQLKRNDDIAGKYIKMIYDDYNKNKDLFRVSIIENKEYTKLSYMITSGKQNDVQLGNHDEDSITIEITYNDNIVLSTYDKTKARMEVTRFKSYLGDLVLFGREINTGKIIDNINGEKENGRAISYVNISSGAIKKLINFFIKEFRRNYPKMTKYYGTRSIMELRPDLRDKSIENYKRGREEYETNSRKKREKIVEEFSSLKMDPDDILDYFVEVTDAIGSKKLDIDYEQSIFIDRVIYDYTPNISTTSVALKNIIRISEYDLDGTLNQNVNKFKEEDIPLQKGVPYHKIMVSLLQEDYSVDEFKQRIDRVIKRIGFGLEVQASKLVEIDPNDSDGGSPNSFMIMEADPNLYNKQFQGIFNNRQASYLFYLKEK